MQVEAVVYWITERELMRQRKEAGARYPFSQDPVMAHTRFTNVRREDDKVTKWLEANGWRNDVPELPQRLTLARMVNYIPTLEEFEGFHEWEEDEIMEILMERADRGEKVWGSAYTITTCGRLMSKEEWVVQHVCAGVRALGPLPNSVRTLDAAHKWLMQVNGLGSFLAAQIVADMKNTKGHQLAHAPDWHSWSAPGPGSLKGLSWFHGIQITPSTYRWAITTAWQAIMPLLAPQLQDLHMQDVQNVFCEVSKYARIKENRGHARNKY
jgi:hypothetical protein